jgi:hypothetical protein
MLMSNVSILAAAPPEGYMNHDALSASCQRLDDQYGACSIDVIGTSREGRSILQLTLAAEGAVAADRSALLLVAGLDGRHLVGAETTIRVAERLLEHHADLLNDFTIYIVPRVNPDGAELNFGPVNAGFIGSIRPVDADRDGALDEDGPDDLNGDGLISTMRRINPPLDDPPTHLPDPNEPRLLKTPDSLKGEAPRHSLYTEGIDNDRDGLYNEDSKGSVDLDRNFMHLWPEHETDAGPYQLSEPESLALAKFVIGHPNIVAAVVYGRHDNLVNVPAGKARDETGQAPRDIDAGDVELYKAVAAIFKEKVGLAHSPQVGIEGSLHAWLYAQRGIPTFATVVWSRPEQAPREAGGGGGEGAPPNGGEPQTGPAGTWSGSMNIPEADTEIPFTVDIVANDDGSLSGSMNALGNAIQLQGASSGDEASLSGSTTVAEETYAVEMRIVGEELTGNVSGPGGMNARFTAQRTARNAQEAPTKPDEKKPDKPADEDAAAWLAYSDEQRGGAGFVNWTPFTHPTLGEVELGGFIPGFQMNPPASDLDALAGKQAEFLVELASKRPRLRNLDPEVSRLASGLYRIRFAITNEGLLPTVTSMSAQARAVTPTIVRLSVPVESIVAGERVARIWTIGGGGRSTHEWIVRVADGSSFVIEIESPQLGDQKVNVLALDSRSTDQNTPQEEAAR